MNDGNPVIPAPLQPVRAEDVKQGESQADAAQRIAIEQRTVPKEQREEREFLTGLLSNLARGVSGRQFDTQVNPAQRVGFTLSNSSLFDRSTLPPNEQIANTFQKEQQLGRVIRGIDPGVYQAGESVVNSVKSMTPDLVRAARPRSTFYEGVPTDFQTNRFNLFTRRQRENHVYAFV